jgi:hypothetical protein
MQVTRSTEELVRPTMHRSSNPESPLIAGTPRLPTPRQPPGIYFVEDRIIVNVARRKNRTEEREQRRRRRRGEMARPKIQLRPASWRYAWTAQMNRQPSSQKKTDAIKDLITNQRLLSALLLLCSVNFPSLGRRNLALILVEVRLKLSIYFTLSLLPSTTLDRSIPSIVSSKNK